MIAQQLRVLELLLKQCRFFAIFRTVPVAAPTRFIPLVLPVLGQTLSALRELLIRKHLPIILFFRPWGIQQAGTAEASAEEQIARNAELLQQIRLLMEIAALLTAINIRQVQLIGEHTLSAPLETLILLTTILFSQQLLLQQQLGPAKA